MEILKWLSEHWDDLTAIAAYLVAVASIIVKLTPTLRDDAVMLKVVKFLSKYIALNRTTKDDEIRSNGK
jgi:hypothetical protein